MSVTPPTPSPHVGPEVGGMILTRAKGTPLSCEISADVKTKHKLSGISHRAKARLRKGCQVARATQQVIGKNGVRTLHSGFLAPRKTWICRWFLHIGDPSWRLGHKSPVHGSCADSGEMTTRGRAVSTAQSWPASLSAAPYHPRLVHREALRVLLGDRP